MSEERLSKPTNTTRLKAILTNCNLSMADSNQPTHLETMNELDTLDQLTNMWRVTIRIREGDDEVLTEQVVKHESSSGQLDMLYKAMRQELCSVEITADDRGFFVKGGREYNAMQYQQLTKLDVLCIDHLAFNRELY